jgi:hypothetical protein
MTRAGLFHNARQAEGLLGFLGCRSRAAHAEPETRQAEPGPVTVRRRRVDGWAEALGHVAILSANAGTLSRDRPAVGLSAMKWARHPNLGKRPGRASRSPVGHRLYAESEDAHHASGSAVRRSRRATGMAFPSVSWRHSEPPGAVVLALGRGAWGRASFVACTRVSAETCKIRDAAGPEVDILIEVHRRMAPMHAIDLANALAEFEPYWFEEPCRSENVEALVEVRHASRIPVVTGETLLTRADFRPVIRARRRHHQSRCLELRRGSRTHICRGGGRIRGHRRFAA